MATVEQLSDRGERRRDWALIITSGGGMVMTAFAAVCLFMIRENAGLVFWLAIAAMLQIFAIFTGLIGLLVKRSFRISKNEINISDFNELIPRREVADALAEVAAPLDELVEEVATPRKKYGANNK